MESNSDEMMPEKICDDPFSFRYGKPIPDLDKMAREKYIRDGFRGRGRPAQSPEWFFQEKPIKIVPALPPANCRNCAAPHDGYSCEYCGTVYANRKVLGLPEPKTPVKPKTSRLTFKEFLMLFVGCALGMALGSFYSRAFSKSTPTLPPATP